MPTITLKFKDTKIRDFSLHPGQTLTIGRRETNDVVIENLAVSGMHAKIDSIDKGFLLTDLKSRNGTFVNDQLIATHWLGHGDTVSIGKHTLVFIYEEGEERPAASAVAMDKTLVMDTDKYRDMLSKSAASAAGKMRNDASAGILTFLAGGNGEFEIKKKLVKLGKDPSSDIVVGGFLTGKTAATISKRPNGYFLSYVGGMAKPKVNDVAVKTSARLNEFDIIEIGPVRLQLSYRS